MKDFWRRAKPFILSALCILIALYFSPLPMRINYAIGTHDVALIWMFFFSHGAFLFAMLGLVIGIFAPIYVLVSLGSVRFQGARYTPIIGYVALIWGVNWLSFFPFVTRIHFYDFWPHRRAGLEQAATRAKPLVAAIEQFKADKKRLPHDLNELVPIYLPAVPQTGMAAYPKFRYSNDGHRKSTYQSYQLQVRTTIGWLNWDTFNYWPEGDYPAQMYGGRVERIGDWGYVHE